MILDPKAKPEDRALADLLCRWYRKNARDLPWRRQRTGYTALVAESMLQQTQVSRVIEPFAAFIRRYPTIRALAEAEQQHVVALWNGLGYYRRARNLHAAAQAIMQKHDGIVPNEVDELMRLPGIGRYTAGAIASMVFNRPAPIVDGNVRRVLSRLAAKADPAPPFSWTWSRAEALVQATASPAILNEAIIELGATVCTPMAPKCHSCPVAKCCSAHARGEPELFPAALKRAEAKSTVHHAVVITRKRGCEILLEQRNDRGMWAGMWQAPTIETASQLKPAQIRNSFAIPITKLEKCGSFIHKTTHRLITFEVYRTTSRSRRGCWWTIASLENLPMSSAQRRVLALAMPKRA